MRKATGLAVMVVACLAHAALASAIPCSLVNFSPLVKDTGISLSPFMYDHLTSSDPAINPGLVNAVVGARNAWNETNARGRLGGYTGFVTETECPAGQPLQIGAFDFTTDTTCATTETYKRARLIDPLTTVAFVDYHANNFFLTNFGFVCPHCGTKSITLNLHFVWSLSPEQPDHWDVHSVLAHEFGHVLGFGHMTPGPTCSDQNSAPRCSQDPDRNTMGNPVHGGETCERDLSGFDKLNANSLYPPPQESAHDFDNDVKADILWRNTSTGDVSVWLMNGAAVAGSGSPGTAPLVWQIAGVADFDGDGKADILWRNATWGDVLVWLMDGTAVALLAGSGSPGSAPLVWQIAGVGDFNGDGKADILWRHTGSGDVVVWLMNGLTVLGSGVVGNTSLDWQIAGVGDFNGDGRADILWRQASGAIAMWLMNGLTLAGSGVAGSVGTDWTIARVGDFNGDGKADILWRHTSGTVAIWLMNGLGIAGSGVAGSVGTDWTIAGVGDFNGDGRADILWRQTSGAVAMWFIDGLSVIGAGSPGNASTDWQIQ